MKRGAMMLARAFTPTLIFVIKRKTLYDFL